MREDVNPRVEWEVVMLNSVLNVKTTGTGGLRALAFLMGGRASLFFLKRCFCILFGLFFFFLLKDPRHDDTNRAGKV